MKIENFFTVILAIIIVCILSGCASNIKTEVDPVGITEDEICYTVYAEAGNPLSQKVEWMLHQSNGKIVSSGTISGLVLIIRKQIYANEHDEAFDLIVTTMLYDWISQMRGYPLVAGTIPDFLSQLKTVCTEDRIMEIAESMQPFIWKSGENTWEYDVTVFTDCGAIERYCMRGRKDPFSIDQMNISLVSFFDELKDFDFYPGKNEK